MSQRSEPKTFNPVTMADRDSAKVIDLLNADLIHINRSNFRVEPALAKSWTLSADARTYTLVLRRGVRFSDGHPFDADDVVFSFGLYLDEAVRSPQRDLLVISGRPLQVRKVDAYTIAFMLPSRYAAGERLFDSIPILPRHVLHKSAKARELSSAWGVNTDPKQIVGLGPFRLKQFVPGQRVVLERNPFYWKADSAGQRLPYLDEVISEVVPNSEAEAMRFLSGGTDLMNRMTAANFAALKPEERRRDFRLYDLGPGFEYSFLFFNLNSAPAVANSGLAEKQKWFSELGFRQAVAEVIDRDSIVRLVYRGSAYPLSGPMSPANSFWADRRVPRPVRSVPQAREWLRKAGFHWSRSGSLQDRGGTSVELSLLVNTANRQQQQMGVIIQQDLKELGIHVTLNALEYRSFLHRLFSSFDYETAIMTLADGDADPNTELSFLLSTGTNHVWGLKPGRIPTWQIEIDVLMQKQLTARNSAERKQWFDQVQESLWRNKPVVFLISPNILVGASNEIGNFNPAKLPDYTLWNADQLFHRSQQRTTGR
ncbi:MAG: ABC transporter substrate-binding protein [Bryobacteraceae bacterium]